MSWQITTEIRGGSTGGFCVGINHYRLHISGRYELETDNVYTIRPILSGHASDRIAD